MIPTDNLSEHFTIKEMSCPHCGKLAIQASLIFALEALRSLGPEPIIVHDAYRCDVHNLAVGGVPNSEHPKGEAADIEIKGLSTEQMFDRANAIELFKNGGIGVYDHGNFIHVDVRKTPARWSRINGQYRPISALLKG